MKITLIKDMYTQAPFKQQKRTLRFLPSVVCLLFIVILQQNIIAQTLGINTTGALPDSSAMLDIISPTKGLLIPRVSLVSTTDTATITNPATSLLVYNTNSAMTGGSGLGYYYYNGSMWMNFLSGTGNSLTTPLIIGGSETTSSLTYKPTTGVGTTGADHIFEVGNNGATEAMRILNNGKVGIGTSSPATELDVDGGINSVTGYRIANAATSGYYLRGNGTDFVSSAIQPGDFPSGSGNYVQNQVASDQAAGLRITGNGLFNGGQITIGTATPSSGYLLTMNTSSGISKGLDIAMSGGTGTGVNVTSSSSAHDGILVSNSSSSVSASFNGIGSVLSSTNIVSGYSGFRNSSGLSYGIYGINGTNATYATNASTWAAFLRGRTVISSETSPSSGLGTDLEIRNTTSGAGNPATVSMRQGTSNTTNATVLANLNFGDNHQAGPQAQIQITRGAAGGASDLPTDMVFSTTPDASATLTERMRILNNGNVGIGTTAPATKLHVYNGSSGGTAYTNSYLLVENSGRSIIQLLAPNANDSYLMFGSPAAANRGYVGYQNSANATPDQMVFQTSGTFNFGGGNVGIGATSPTSKLHVVTSSSSFMKLDRSSNLMGYEGATTLSGGFGLYDYGAGVMQWYVKAGNMGIGITSPSAKFHVLSTTEQSRLGYDASNYYSTTVGSTGAVTFDAVGAGSAFTFSDAVNLPTASVGVTQTLNDSTTKLATTAFVDRALSGVSGGSGWGLTGTSGTVDGTNFIGTTDNIPLNIKVNNQKAGRIDATLYSAFWGYQAGGANTTGYDNVSIGHQALYTNTTGYENTATGFKALYANTTGNGNTAIGSYSLISNTTGYYNTANGFQTLRYNTTGTNNTAVGYQALLSNTSGQPNQAFGSQSLSSNTTGVDNNAYGYNSLKSNTTGANNAAFGNYSSWKNTSGSYNVALGHTALQENLVGTSNVAVGYQALLYNTASSNIGVGGNTLFSNTSGSQNTAIGLSAGSNNTTTNNNTYLGYNANATAGLNNVTSIGANTSVNASNKVRIGDANVTVIEGQVAFTSVSDGRFKKYISETDVKGLSFIMRLRPVAYNLDTKQFEEFLTKNQPDSIRALHFKNKDFTASTAIRHSGFVAQEVELAAQQTNYDFNGIHKPEGPDDNYGLAYSEFVVPLVKAMQEQQKIIDDLKLEIDKLKVEVSKNQGPK